MKKYIFLITIIFLYSCTSNTIYKKPKDLIPKDTMVAIITDLYLASAARSFKNVNNQKNINYSPLVYDKYGIDSLRFKNSNFYYTTKIDQYPKLLEQVKKNLEDNKKVFTAQKQIKDSIRLDSIKKNSKKTLKEKKELFKIKNLKDQTHLLEKKVD